MRQDTGVNQLERSITLVGAVALVVGGVIGAGIYALIGAIGAKAGYATWLAFTIAMFISVIGAIPVIQVASAMPRAGAGYLFTGRLLHPMAGTIVSGVILLAGACSTALVLVAMGTYLPPAAASIPTSVVSLGILALFYIVMLLGVRLAVGIQVIMVAQMVAALALYCAAGLATTPLTFSMTPRLGYAQFFAAVVLCYNVCMGFQVLAELGEEIRDARRNIPRALLIGGIIVALIYIVTGMVLVNSLPYNEEAYDPSNAPLDASARLFLPAWAVTFVNFGSLTAGLTSLNAAAVALPRELFAQARDGMLPTAFGRVAGSSHIPRGAVSAFFAIVAVLVLQSFSQEFYGLMAAAGIQIVTAAICVASLRLPRQFPHLYSAAYVTFPLWLLWACTIITVLTTVGFVVIVVAEMSVVAANYAVLAAALAGYYVLRTRYLRRNGRAPQSEVNGED